MVESEPAESDTFRLFSADEITARLREAGLDSEAGIAFFFDDDQQVREWAASASILNMEDVVQRWMDATAGTVQGPTVPVESVQPAAPQRPQSSCTLVVPPLKRLKASLPKVIKAPPSRRPTEEVMKQRAVHLAF